MCALNVLVGDLLQFFLQSVDVLATFADDHTGAGGADSDSDHLEGAFDDDFRNACLGKTSAEVFTDFGVLEEGCSVFLSAEPV